MSKVLKSLPSSEYFMRMVYLVATRSKDPRTKIGAVLIRDGTLISSGFNGFPRGVIDLESRYQDRTLKHQLVCHAEANSILSAARNGISTLDSVLFTQGVPCSECSKSIIQSGCQKVIVHKQWPNLIHSQAWIDSVKLSRLMLEESGVEVEWLDKQLDLEGILDGKTISV